MKKLTYLAAVLMAVSTVVSSCGKDDDDNGTPNGGGLTQEQIDELNRQEQKKQEQKENINVGDDGLLLEYTADFYISETSYDGVFVTIDTAKIAETLGITPAQLSEGIAGNGSIELTMGFIEGSTHNDVLTATNTNAAWGHWYNADGDLTAWGGDADNAATCPVFFTEYDTDKNGFNIGQYPGHIKEEKSFTCIEFLSYDDIRVAVKITINAKMRGALSGTILETKTVEFNTSVYNENSDEVDFDFASVVSKLGASSMDDITYITLKEDGSYAQEPDDASAGLYWMSTSGVYTGYSNGNCYVYSNVEDGKIGLGQYANKLDGFSGECTLPYGFYYNGNIVMVDVKVKVTAFEDTEDKPAGDPASAEVSYTAEKAWDNEYKAVTVDVKDAIKNAFKMTCYEAYQAYQAGTLKLYAVEVSEDAPSYTATAPGYWMGADGAACAYSDGHIYAELKLNDFANQVISINLGNHPDNCSNEDHSYAVKLILTDGTTSLTMNIAYDIKAAAEVTE